MVDRLKEAVKWLFSLAAQRAEPLDPAASEQAHPYPATAEMLR
jgi:hypothetical protein